MVDDQPIDLVTGESRWLRIIRYSLFFTSAVSLATASTDPIWKYAGLTGLGLVYILMSLSLYRMSHIRSLRLLGDGMITLGRVAQSEIPACLREGGWSTAWITVIPIHRIEDHVRLRVLVCRSLNHSQDYRRLLSRMRLGSGSRAENGILGPT